jgi:hypothetical protein
MTKKQNQMEANIDESNVMVLVESRTMRDQHVFRDEILDKVKIVPMLADSVEVTLQMAATYYDVPLETIRTIVKRHRNEFNEYEELRLLKGKSLTEFKTMVQDELPLKGINSLQLISRRGLLRLGMLLTESEVAKSIRNYLLNVEEVSDKAQREWAVEREISKRERRRLTDAIQLFYEGSSMHGREYSTFTNLVYKTLFDCNAAQLRKLYGIEKNDPLRDSLTTEDLRKVVDVEQVIASFIKVGKNYHEIKDLVLSKKEKFQ